MKSFLSDYPEIDKLGKELKSNSLPEYREVNGHIHTPFSFSAFPDLDSIFRHAVNENIAALGINDFFVSDGYSAFNQGCLKNNVFPLFNIEFIGLLRNEQKSGIRINDPNNPGRIYFSGKGLDFPFHTGWLQKMQLNRVIKKSQEQMKAMIGKLNELISTENPSLQLSYETVKSRYARDLVRERHLAKAVRILAAESFSDPEMSLGFIEKLYGDKKSRAGIANTPALENEIRSNLLKSGGRAFIEEDEKSFPELGKIIDIILKAGGIPCYPVLLDDASGKFTEFEGDPEKLYNSLKNLGVGCIEFIPGRNDIGILGAYCDYFNKKDFIITFGTEHNTPEMIPLTVTARGGVPLTETLKKISWQGACVIAAHQYLRATGRQGYILEDGTHSSDQKKSLEKLGALVIEYYLKTNKR